MSGQFYFKPKPKKVAAVETATLKAVEKPRSSASDDLTDRTLVSTAYRATVAVGTCGAYPDRKHEAQRR